MNPLLKLFENEPTITIPEGEVILREGHPVNTLYVLIAGEVEVLKGDTCVNRISEPGSLFGEMSYLLNQDASATLRAGKYTCLYKIDTGFAWSHPEIFRYVSVQLAARLQANTQFLIKLEERLSKEGEKVHLATEIAKELKNIEALIKSY